MKIQFKKTNQLKKYEKETKITFPQLYRDFYLECKKSVPSQFIGSDLFNYYPVINKAAEELLIENEVENFLSKDDFVFMMHQGYMFWYFRADGMENPDVYFYDESDQSSPYKVCSLEEFIKYYPKTNVQ